MGCSNSKETAHDGYDRSNVQRRKEYVERNKDAALPSSPLQVAAKLTRLRMSQQYATASQLSGDSSVTLNSASTTSLALDGYAAHHHTKMDEAFHSPAEAELTFAVPKLVDPTTPLSADGTGPNNGSAFSDASTSIVTGRSYPSVLGSPESGYISPTETTAAQAAGEEGLVVILPPRVACAEMDVFSASIISSPNTSVIGGDTPLSLSRRSSVTFAPDVLTTSHTDSLASPLVSRKTRSRRRFDRSSFSNEGGDEEGRNDGIPSIVTIAIDAPIVNGDSSSDEEEEEEEVLAERKITASAPQPCPVSSFHYLSTQRSRINADGKWVRPSVPSASQQHGPEMPLTGVSSSTLYSAPLPRVPNSITSSNESAPHDDQHPCIPESK